MLLQLNSVSQRLQLKVPDGTNCKVCQFKLQKRCRLFGSLDPYQNKRNECIVSSKKEDTWSPIPQQSK